MNPSKRKGTAWESAIVAYLRPWFPWVERRALSGSNDKGDISGIPGLVIEAKDAQRHELAVWMNEAEQERKNAGASLALLVIKRRRKPVGDAYAVMTLRQAVELIRDEDTAPMAPNESEVSNDQPA